MDISAIGIATLATQMAQDRNGTAVQVAVLKKANDLAAQTALQLLQALPAAAPASNPAHLGNVVDTFA